MDTGILKVLYGKGIYKKDMHGIPYIYCMYSQRALNSCEMPWIRIPGL
jgi:hypothetical protein